MKVCFVGVGSIGKRHIKNLSKICKHNNEALYIHALRATDKRLPEEIRGLVSREFKSIVNIDREYDMIFITNPTYLHYDTIDQLKHHSKCFFIEKPVVNNLDQDILSLNLPKKNIYYVACPLRYTKILQEAEHFLKEHQPFSVRVISSSYLPEWREHVDYRKTYSAHRTQGGGVCIDLIHEWDYLYSFFGKPLKQLQFAGKFSDLEIDSDDLAVYIAQYKTFLLELHLDYFGRKAERKMEVYCAEGSYTFDILNSRILKNGEIIWSYKETSDDKYVAELENFLEICKGRAINSNDVRHAMEVLRITSGK